MTREEAIKELTEEFMAINPNDLGCEEIERYASALNMAIEALKERPQDKWEYLKEHITELRDANGYATQYGTCKFILNLMSVIEKEGEAREE